MLSCSLLMSLALTGCGGDPHQLTAPVAEQPAAVQNNDDALLAAASFEQLPGERPHILASEPRADETPDWSAGDAWMSENIPATLNAGHTPETSVQQSADVFMDQFGNMLHRAPGLLLADASAQTSNGPGATATDAGSGVHYSTRHPRPRPHRPANDSELPSWARTGGYLNAQHQPNADKAAPDNAGSGNAGNGNSAGNTAPTTPPAANQNGGASQQGSTTQPASRNRLVTATNLQLDSPEFNRLYGPGVFTQNALANTVIGSYRNQTSVVSNRFRATVSGQLDRVRLYWQSGIGYAGGTGGVIRLSLYPDDGSSAHLPNLGARPLASGTFAAKLKPGDNPKSIFPEIRMDTKNESMVAGRIYHLVLENIDPNAHENFISSNNSITPLKNGRPARWLNTTDWSTLIGKRPRGSTRAFSWTNLTEVGSGGNIFSPILQLSLTNGQSQGVSDMEGGTVDNKLIYTVTAQKPIRERFTPRSDKRVSGLSFATAASVAGRLQWRILDGNTELFSGYVNESRPNYNPIQSNPRYKVGNFKWYDIELPRDLVMKAGRAYDLEFRPEGGSQWKFGDHRNGSSYGYTWPAAFTESQAQLMLGGSWIGSNHWNHAQNGSGANWPVVLHLAP